jgi:hypothetical protein
MFLPTSEDDQGASLMRGRRVRKSSGDRGDKSHLSDSGSDGGLCYEPPKIPKIRNAPNAKSK